MQFVPNLVQLAEKPTPQQPDSEIFLDWIYPFHAICTTFGSAGRKAPLLWTDSEKILDWIYPFHAISSNFGSAGRKAHPTPLMPPMPDSENL